MTEEEKKSYILIQFAELGSVVANTIFENVTPLQVLAISGYLELKAKNELVRVENERLEQQLKQQLAVPENKIILPH